MCLNLLGTPSFKHGTEHNTHDQEIIQMELILITCWKFFIVLRAISDWPLGLEVTDMEL